MLNFANAKIPCAVVHHLPNPSIGNPSFAKDTFEPDESLSEQVFDYLKRLFPNPEYFKFGYTNGDFVLNPVYNYACNTFDDEAQFLEHSTRIAKTLLDHSKSELIKDGDLLIFYIKGILFEDNEILDAICLLKIESKSKFIQLSQTNELIVSEGIDYQSIDKACLILHNERKFGLKVLNKDRSNIGNASKYWQDDFLHLIRFDNEYLFTNQYIKLTANFIKQKTSGFNPEDNVEQAASLQKAQKYFQKNENFVEEEFVHEVFDKPAQKAEFARYKALNEENTNMSYPKEFEISPEGVKKIERVFKSVIKLDKNFHIYVHGDTRKIIKGEDNEGRKFYTLYYDSES